LIVWYVFMQWKSIRPLRLAPTPKKLDLIFSLQTQEFTSEAYHTIDIRVINKRS
jgi:hypothetical protein